MSSPILRATVLASLLLCGCRAAPAQAPPLQPGAAAQGFVQALNGKNIGAMSERATTPFSFRNQAWESASDGAGYVLGRAVERAATNADELRALLEEIAATVAIEDPTPVAMPPSKSQLLTDFMKGAPPQWNEAELVLFRRGEGDVEHIAIVSVTASGKVNGLYVN
jgi:hypothetical protein